MNKEVTKLVRQLRSQGLEVVPSGSGHFNVLQNGNKVWGIPATPSDRRWLANTMTDLKKRGLWNPDAKKKRSGGGQSPPPLPDFSQMTAKEEPLMVPIKKNSKIHSLPDGWRDSLELVFQDVRDRYGLHEARLGRKLSHGTVPIIGNVVDAYTTDHGLPIPDLRSGDTDHSVLAYRSADRVAKVYSDNPDLVSILVLDSVEITLEAWDWFAAQDYVFPDGRTLRVDHRGVTAVWPDLPEDDEDVDDVGAWDRTDDVEPQSPLIGSETSFEYVPVGTSGSSINTTSPYPAFPTFTVAASTNGHSNGVSMRRARLAIEVAAAIKDFDRAYTLASKILEV